jgi:hypothetical protein
MLPHYNMNNPKIIELPKSLTEISGLSFVNGNKNVLFAEEDENGRLYYFSPGEKKISFIKFGKKGDYEDLAICNGRVIVLRSDGVFFIFQLITPFEPEATNVTEINGLLPEGEYESLYADQLTNKLYVLCKNCKSVTTKRTTPGFVFQIHENDSISASGTFQIDEKKLGKIAGLGKMSFRPSAFAKNPATKEWYMISSINKILVTADSLWNIKDVFPLDRSLFNQPEGIAFDSSNSMYISNEGRGNQNANILKFEFNGN